MFKQIILPILGVVAFIILVGLLVQKSPNLDLSNFLSPTVSKATVNIGDKKINVEVAKTDADREKGLSGRNSLDVDSGMLFVFDTIDITPSFWMKGMLFSIDVIWINDGKIARIDKNTEVPATGTPDNKLKLYSPGRPIDYVLEVAAGFSDKNNIKVGDSVTISGI